jgi:hypothetical protein
VENENLCPDELTLTVNGSGELELQYDTEFFEMSSEGLAFKNHLGYVRSFTPVLRSNATPITMGASTMTGLYTRVRMSGNYVLPITYQQLDYYLTEFSISLTLGAGFSIPAGTLKWVNGSPTGILGAITPNYGGGVYAQTGMVGTVKFLDASTPANNRTRILYNDGNGEFLMRDYTGAAVTNSSLFTFATGDQIIVSGFCFSTTNNDSVLT